MGEESGQQMAQLDAGLKVMLACTRTRDEAGFRIAKAQYDGVLQSALAEGTPNYTAYHDAGKMLAASFEARASERLQACRRVDSFLEDMKYAAMGHERAVFRLNGCLEHMLLCAEAGDRDGYGRTNIRFSALLERAFGEDNDIGKSYDRMRNQVANIIAYPDRREGLVRTVRAFLGTFEKGL